MALLGLVLFLSGLGENIGQVLQPILDVLSLPYKFITDTLGKLNN